MADIYVSKSGNDANPGTAALPKLTIGAAMAAMVSGDRVIVRRGIYKEAVTFQQNGASFELKAEGHVIVDGENLRGLGININFIGTPSGAARTVDGFVVRNHTIANVRCGGNNQGEGGLQQGLVKNCLLYNAPVGIEGAPNDGFSGGYAVDSQSNIIHSCATAAILMHSLGGGFGTGFRMKNTLAFGCGAGIIYRLTAGFTTINTIFASCTRGVDFESAPTVPAGLDWNDYFGNTNVGRFNSVDYATLAAWKAASTRDTNSLGVDPLFIDSLIKLFGLQVTSPLIGTGLNGEDIGPRGKAQFAQSNNFSPADWAGGVFVNTQLAGGQIELVAPNTVGTYASVVKDLGASQTLRVDGFDLLASENEPVEVVDTDNNDVNPNRKMIEVRLSPTPFGPTDVVPSYTKIEQGEGVTAPLTLAGRYMQYRLTLRKDGVSA